MQGSNYAPSGTELGWCVTLRLRAVEWRQRREGGQAENCEKYGTCKHHRDPSMYTAYGPRGLVVSLRGYKAGTVGKKRDSAVFWYKFEKNR